MRCGRHTHFVGKTLRAEIFSANMTVRIILSGCTFYRTMVYQIHFDAECIRWIHVDPAQVEGLDSGSWSCTEVIRSWRRGPR